MSLLKIYRKKEGRVGEEAFKQSSEQREIMKAWSAKHSKSISEKINKQRAAKHWLSRGTSPYVHSWISETVSNSPLSSSRLWHKQGNLAWPSWSASKITVDNMAAEELHPQLKSTPESANVCLVLNSQHISQPIKIRFPLKSDLLILILADSIFWGQNNSKLHTLT